jgi:hypothetical protein
MCNCGKSRRVYRLEDRSDSKFLFAEPPDRAYTTVPGAIRPPFGTMMMPLRM